MKCGLEIIRKQAQNQLQVRLWPFKFITEKLGDIQVSERRIERRISQFEQSVIDRLNEMADMTRCAGLKNEIAAIFYPVDVLRKLCVHWTKNMSPSETYGITSHCAVGYFDRQDSENSLFLTGDTLSTRTMDACKYYERPRTGCLSYSQSE